MRQAKARVSRLAAAILAALVLGSALAPAGIAAGPTQSGAAAKSAPGRDDKCRQIKNKKKRKRCVAKHEKPGHH